MSVGLIQTVLLILVIAFIVYMTAKLRVNAFLVLLLAALIYGILSFVFTGTPPLLDVKKDNQTITGVINLITGGFGSTLTSIGIVIVLGTILGYFLEKTGAAIVMAETILKIVGSYNAPLAMAIAGYIVSIPVFCDSGFVILQALNRSLAEASGISLAVMGTALSMGLYSTHCLVPPTPGPVAAAGNIGVDLGIVILLGLLASIPATIAGWLYAVKVGKNIWIDPGHGRTFKELKQSFGQLPSPFMSFLPIVLPLILIALNSIASFPSNPFGTGLWRQLFVFLGNPNIALLIGVFIASTLTKWEKQVFDGWIGEAIKTSAIILVITAAGGSLGSVLRASGVGNFLGTELAKFRMGLFLPFVIAAAIKTAQGSSTVSLITTSSILAPMLPSLGYTTTPQKALVVLAIGAGSMIVSHANDSYFWVVANFSDMDVGQAYKLQTAGSLVTGIGAMIGVLILSLIFG
ncbi:MAG: GntP family permease [Caldisericum sp.]|uniref:GntP family permease n=1 Tax=Caldisericum sp. TaxID=2499687 RepID=UPI003D118D95